MNIAELRRLEAKRPWDINDIDAVRNTLPELLKAVEMAERNLETRDQFLVQRGLWSDFVDSLPPHGGGNVG